MKTLNELNVTLNKMQANKALIDTTRATAVNDIIALVTNETLDINFTSKKDANKYVITKLLSDDNKNLNTYTKRALKIAYALIIEGYKIKKESLTLAQAENILRSDKSIVNAMMKLDSEIADDKGETEYSIAVKSEIKSHDKIKANKALGEIKEAKNELEKLLSLYGDDTKKVLNLMIKAL